MTTILLRRGYRTLKHTLKASKIWLSMTAAFFDSSARDLSSKDAVLLKNIMQDGARGIEAKREKKGRVQRCGSSTMLLLDLAHHHDETEGSTMMHED